MKRWPLVVVFMVMLMTVTAAGVSADEDAEERQGYGYGYGHGPGMMGPSFGYGPGMMGPGMMGPGYGYGHGPGMMGPGFGHGPGMMGPGMMGPGMMGPGFGYGPGMMYGLTQLPAEKREQLQKAHVETMQAMLPRIAEMTRQRLALAEALRQFPVDAQGARDAREQLDKTRAELFDLRLELMATVQEIVGQELWERMHGGGYPPAPGVGPGGMMGPGHGPRR